MNNISMISFGSGTANEQIDRRKERAQDVATGAGVTGAAAYQAKRTTVNNTLKNMFTHVTEVTKTTRQNAAEVTGLFGKFKFNMKRFSGSIINQAMKFKDMKYIGPLVKSPITKGIATGFGAAMAFFALVTGVDKAYRNGKLAVADEENIMGNGKIIKCMDME